MKNKQAIHERVMRIMNLAYLINVETDFAAFVEFAGHANVLSISIRDSKTNYNEFVASFERYMNVEPPTVKMLDDVIDSLEGFLGNEVPYDLLKEVEVKAIEYLL